MAESSKTAVPATKQESQASETKEATEAEVSAPKADKPEESAEKEERPSNVETASISSKVEAQRVKTSHDTISTASTPSAGSTASQQEVTVNQLVAEFLPRSLDEISDEELYVLVINLENSIHLMRIENEVFECYIRRIDPTILEDFHERLEHIITRSRQSALKRPSSLSVSSRGSTRRDNAFTLLENGPRITLTTKSDILDEETVLVEHSLDQFHAEMEHAHVDLKATEEEAGILTHETLESMNRFEKMSIYSVDPVTGRIPAEKFVRYMQDWLKIAESTIEKLRLHTNSMHQSITHLKRQIRDCRDLGYTIQPIDFDQMKIENRLLKETLAMKNKYLLELKYLSDIANSLNDGTSKRNGDIYRLCENLDNSTQEPHLSGLDGTGGKCSLVLVQHKKKLMQQESQGHTIAERIEMQKGNIRKVEKEHEVTKHKLQRAEPKLANLREFIDAHDCPSVMEYVKVIDEVNRLKQDIHKWERRHGTQQLTLESQKMEISSLHFEDSHLSEPSFTSRSDSQKTTEENLT